MTETELLKRVRVELLQLLSDLDNGREPRNEILSNAVFEAVREIL